jgi:hypothetical protein
MGKLAADAKDLAAEAITLRVAADYETLAQRAMLRSIEWCAPDKIIDRRGI